VDRGSRLRNFARLGRTFVTGFDLPPYERYDHSVQMLPEAEVRRLCPGLPEAEDLLCERRQHFGAAGSGDPVTPLLHLDLKTSLVDSLLLLTDRMTMATSLEARVPFLDHQLIETAARMPASLKVQGTRLRHIQRRAMRGQLPDEVFQRKKRGFGCPVGRWFRRELRELLRDTLAADVLRAGGLFDPSAVAAMIDAHEQYREDRSETLLALLTFQIWQGQVRASAPGCQAPAPVQVGG
jgi:asparagine synthase (glutamine-hydrolysing)